MDSQVVPQSAEQVTRTTQVIVVLMAIWLIAFGGYLFVNGVAAEPEVERGINILSITGCAMAVMMIVSRFFVPTMIVAGQRSRIANLFPEDSLESSAEDRNESDSIAIRHLFGAFQFKTIIAVALLEGGALLNLIAYMLEGQAINLIVSGVLIVLILSLFPTQHTVENWLEGEIAVIKQMREL